MKMIIASSSPIHRSSHDGESSVVSGTTKSYRIQRRNTISDSRSRCSPRPTNLDSVIEHSDSFIMCSQQFGDIINKKHSRVGDTDSYTPRLSFSGKSSTLPRNFSRKHPDITMAAWKAGKQPSPSPPNETSWFETISTKISEKKRKSGIFGSLRGRHKDKKKDNNNEHNTPKSPLNVRARSDTETSNRTVQQTKPSLEFQGSTGFQCITPIDLTDSATNEPNPISISGSFKETTGPSMKSVTNIRKSNSLPRTILCSPVMSRKMKRPTVVQQWNHNEIVVDDILCHSSSPPSSNMSSRIGSVDTLQPSINMSEEQAGVSVVTPTAMNGWQYNNRTELVHKISLTRSSSVPFEAEISSSQLSVNNEQLTEKSTESLSVNRLATRSHSFNTHYRSHSIVQKSHSYEEQMIMRERVLLFLLETEQSYILSLKLLAKEYYNVLSLNGLMQDYSVNELFIAVNELTLLHQTFAKKVEERLSKWSRNEIIGDVLLDMFTSTLLRSIYSKYIQYYSKARITIESCIQSRPSLVKELEECNRGNNSRLGLKDLLIKPVQRIPRYMLFVKDIIKYTSHTHSDNLMLQQGLNELRDLANSVNETERISDRLQQHKELLSTVDGLAECLTSHSVFLRCDGVIELKGSVQRKDRLLLLFSDAVVCAGIRRKGTGFRRGSLMNINSTQIEATTRYQVKWCTQLPSLSVTHSQAPLFERRRYNTLEKSLHCSQKDEALLIQMMTLASSLNCNHQQLNTVLQEMVDQLRGGMYNRQEEINTLPNDTARLDLISHDSVPACKYFLVFINQKERQRWEHTLRNAQLSSTPSFTRYKTEENDYGNPSPPPAVVPKRQSSFHSQTPKIHSHLSIPSCRVGAQLSSTAVSLCQDSPKIFVTINDSCGRGSIAIINPINTHLVATLPLSSSNLLCSICVPHPSGDINDSFSFSDSGEIPFFTNSVTHNPPLPPRSAIPDRNIQTKIDTPLDMLRSSSAPPTSFNNIVTNDWSTSCDQWLWLGSEGGIIYLLKVGVSSLHVGTSVSFNVKSSVECLLSHNNRVWAGLRDGRLVMFQLQPDISYEYYSISANSNPVTCLAPAGHIILATTGDTVVGVSSLTAEYKQLIQLNPNQQIVDVVISDRLVFLSIKDSLLIVICTFTNTGLLDQLCTMDCTNAVLSMLKNYDSIVKQHKYSYPHITNISCTDNIIIIGTSTGVLVWLPLPLIPGHIPLPQPLVTGHVDTVSMLIITTIDHYNILISGGHGLEDLTNSRLYNNVSETEGCITLWRLPSLINHTH